MAVQNGFDINTLIGWLEDIANAEDEENCEGRYEKRRQKLWDGLQLIQEASEM